MADLDGGGSIEYSELATIIRRSTAIAPQVKVRRRRGDAPSAVQSEAPITGTRSRPENAAPYTLVEIASPSWLPPGYAFPAWELIYEAFPGTNRGTGKVALVTVPSLKPPSILDEPIFSRQLGMVHRFPSSVLRSNLVLRDLVAAGYNILAYEAHAPGATWADAGETTAAHLLAALGMFDRTDGCATAASPSLLTEWARRPPSLRATRASSSSTVFERRSYASPRTMAAACSRRGASLHCAYDACGAPADDDDDQSAASGMRSRCNAMRVTASSCLLPRAMSALSVLSTTRWIAWHSSRSAWSSSHFGVQSSGGALPDVLTAGVALATRGRLDDDQPVVAADVGHVAETPSADAYARTVTACVACIAEEMTRIEHVALATQQPDS